MELQYPFEDKEALYSEMDITELEYALADARKALKRAEDMAREGFTFAGRKGPGWRSDDCATIRKVLRARMTHAHTYGTMRTIDFGKS